MSPLLLLRFRHSHRASDPDSARRGHRTRRPSQAQRSPSRGSQPCGDAKTKLGAEMLGYHSNPRPSPTGAHVGRQTGITCVSSPTPWSRHDPILEHSCEARLRDPSQAWISSQQRSRFLRSCVSQRGVTRFVTRCMSFAVSVSSDRDAAAPANPLRRPRVPRRHYA